MGREARLNRTPQARADRTLRRMLAFFPDRATYEQWLAARRVSDAHRVHMEQFLPAHLKPQGSV